MEDKWTEKPTHLKKRIEKVNKMIEDAPKYREWWDSLPDEEKSRIDALPPGERDKEIEHLFSNPNPNPPPPDPNLNPDDQPPPTGEPETIESLKANLAETEQKYRTLQGMMKETGEQEHQINVLLSQIKMLQDQIHEMQQKTTKPEEKPKKVNVREALKEHYDALAEDIAPDILEKQIKKDERLFEIIDERANQNISEVATRFDSTLKLNAKEKFYKDLNDWGDWEALWKTPEFQGFLDEEDGISGFKRIAIIDDAFARFDSRPVLRAFNTVTGKVGRGTKEPPPNIDPNKVKNRVGPPRSSGPSLSNPKENKNQMSPQAAREALVALTNKYTRGQFKGSKEEYDKEYARLFNLAKGGTG